MSYEGDIAFECADVDWNVVWAVVVSGATANPCGHARLYAESERSGGRYWHVAQVYGFPRTMRDQTSYERYLKENHKRELRRFKVELKDPFGAAQKLESLIGKKWFWGVLPHNCASFVEEVVQAGGSSAGLYSNCPSREAFR